MTKDSLAVIIPVYNEEGSIENVLAKWMQEFERLRINYAIFAYNDGSKDNTREILRQCEQNSEGTIHVINKANSGHGPTILKGYRDQSSRFEWLFQIDSDDEMSPESFEQLWNARNEYSFLLGYRNGRKQLLPRKVISFVSRTVVHFIYGKTVWDVNSPYRLMRSQDFKELFDTIPENTFAPNLIVSGYVGYKKLSFKEFPIPHSDRKTGEVSIKKWKLLKAALRSFYETIFFRKCI